MRKILRFLVPPALLVAATLAFAPGCGKKGGKDEKAAEACKTAPETKESGDECKKCCNKAGASGHAWIGGKGCECL